jgi:hypothetical protein
MLLRSAKDNGTLSLTVDSTPAFLG